MTHLVRFGNRVPPEQRTRILEHLGALDGVSVHVDLPDEHPELGWRVHLDGPNWTATFRIPADAPAEAWEAKMRLARRSSP